MNSSGKETLSGLDIRIYNSATKSVTKCLSSIRMGGEVLLVFCVVSG